MPTLRTIDDAIAATLESVDESLRDCMGTAKRAVAEEAFAELAVDQLLKLTADSMMERASWAGYRSTSVARLMLERVRTNSFRWGPAWSLCVADAALAIAKRSDRVTPALLFEAEYRRADALTYLARFEEAFLSLETAEAHAAETTDVRRRRAMVANSRAAAALEMSCWNTALTFVREAEEGFAAGGEAKQLERNRACEGAAYFGLGRYEEARRVFNAGLQSATASHNRVLIAIYLGNVGQAFFAMGDVSAARRDLNEAAVLFASCGCRAARAKILATIGLIDISEQGVDGTVCIEEASTVFEEMGMDATWVDTRLDLAQALVSVDSNLHVSDICRQAFARAVSLGIDSLASRALMLLETAVKTNPGSRFGIEGRTV